MLITYNLGTLTGYSENFIGEHRKKDIASFAVYLCKPIKSFYCPCRGGNSPW